MRKSGKGERKEFGSLFEGLGAQYNGRKNGQTRNNARFQAAPKEERRRSKLTIASISDTDLARPGPTPRKSSPSDAL